MNRNGDWDPGHSFDRNDTDRDQTPADIIVYPQCHNDGGVCGAIGTSDCDGSHDCMTDEHTTTGRITMAKNYQKVSTGGIRFISGLEKDAQIEGVFIRKFAGKYSEAVEFTVAETITQAGGVYEKGETCAIGLTAGLGDLGSLLPGQEFMLKGLGMRLSKGSGMDFRAYELYAIPMAKQTGISDQSATTTP
jgi:hypothetical protein